jgi:hypothetical protein
MEFGKKYDIIGQFGKSIQQYRPLRSEKKIDDQKELHSTRSVCRWCKTTVIKSSSASIRHSPFTEQTPVNYEKTDSNYVC